MKKSKKDWNVAPDWDINFIPDWNVATDWDINFISDWGDFIPDWEDEVIIK